MVKTWIELHDCEVLQVNQRGTDAVVLLDAYVHRWELIDGSWRGTGWTQPVRCIIGHARTGWTAPALPARISDGHLSAPDEGPGNLIPMPFHYESPARLSLVLDTGEPIELEGTSVQLESSGPARFVDDLPDDLRPDSTSLDS